ncbi:MAG: thiamine biosynthesis lipoprotein [Pseudonocardiales bacterium]|nr:thiamine biosynthesis lipoprotein [Pseudonocardiales bacterium]
MAPNNHHLVVAPAGPVRAVHVEHCMGTAFTIDIRDDGAWDDAFSDVVAWLHHVDGVFSTYQPDSDISRIQRRELRATDAHPDVLTVLELCAQVQATTEGCFTAMPGGKIDPSGLVKGWAVEEASTLLRRHGSSNHAVNGGGDLQLAGGSAPDLPWRVGITDPHDRSRVLAVVTGRDFAVATSGISERGSHIVDPSTGRAPTGRASATVPGPSLTYADAYATAAFVLGPHAIDWIRTVDGYHAMLVTADGAISASSGWPGPIAPM